MAANLISALGMLFTTVLILVLAYATSRWIATHGAPGASTWAGLNGGGENFRVLSRIGVGRNASLLVLYARGRCMLLGVTEQNITLLKEWEGEEAEAWLSEPPPDAGFLGVLRDTLNRPRRNDDNG